MTGGSEFEPELALTALDRLVDLFVPLRVVSQACTGKSRVAGQWVSSGGRLQTEMTKTGRSSQIHSSPWH